MQVFRVVEAIEVIEFFVTSKDKCLYHSLKDCSDVVECDWGESKLERGVL